MPHKDDHSYLVIEILEEKKLFRDMVDESGELLGGKRAAIQYAYETSVSILVVYFATFCQSKLNPKKDLYDILYLIFS